MLLAMRSVEIRLISVIAPCSLVGIDQRFIGATASIRAMMAAVRTSETSVYSMETTMCYIPEGSKLHARRLENLKSHNEIVVLTAVRMAMFSSGSLLVGGRFRETYRAQG
jgi:hypothetical protein